MNCRTHLNIDISNAHCGPWRNIQDHSCLRAGCIKTYTTLCTAHARSGVCVSRTYDGVRWSLAATPATSGPFKYDIPICSCVCVCMYSSRGHRRVSARVTCVRRSEPPATTRAFRLRPFVHIDDMRDNGDARRSAYVSG